MTTLIYHPGVGKTDLIVLVGGVALYITESIKLNKGNKLITSTPTTESLFTGTLERWGAH